MWLLPLFSRRLLYPSLTPATSGLQGYGLTESCAASFLALPRKGHAGTVGPPVPGTEFCLKGDEEMGYDPNGDPPRGEICIRGPILFSGYYKEKELTADAIGAQDLQMQAAWLQLL